MDEVKTFAENLANAADRTVVIGVRPRGKGWFVRCDDTEFDAGDDLLVALKAIRDRLVAVHRSKLIEMAQHRDMLTALEAT